MKLSAVFVVALVVGFSDALDHGTAVSNILNSYADLAVLRAGDALENHMNKRSVSTEEERMTRALKDIFTTNLKEALGKISEKVRDLLSKGKQTGSDAVKKVNDLVAKIKELGFEGVKSELLNALNDLKGKSADMAELDKIKEMLAKLKEEVENKSLDDITTGVVSNPHQYGMLDSIKGVFAKLPGKLVVFKDWMKEKLTVLWEAAQPVVEIVKEMAVVFIVTAATQIAKEGLNQAIKFFEEHKDELGTLLWEQVQQVFKQASMG